MSVLTALRPEEKEVPAPEPKPSHRGLLEIGGAPDSVWDTADPQSVDVARARFNRAIMAGYAAQSYRPAAVGSAYSSTYGEMTREFDPEADNIRMTLPYAGG